MSGGTASTAADGRCAPSATTPARSSPRPIGELQLHGSRLLFQWLVDNDLIDEITLLIVPVVLGQGARLFADSARDAALELRDSRVDTKGTTIQVYRPAGRPDCAPNW